MARGRPPATEHGDYGYARRLKCRCDLCRASMARYQKRYHYDRSRGIRRRLDAEPVRAHIRELVEQGILEHQISSAAGVFHTVLANIIRGKMGDPPAGLLLAPTAEKILAVTYEQAAAVPRLIDSIGVIRRVQALEYLGIPKKVLAGLLGVTECAVHQYVGQAEVLTTTRDAVHAGYVQLRETRGTSEYARWRAYRRDFKPPMCWDDETIDDPSTVPHEAVCVFAICSKPTYKWSLCEWHYRQVYAANGDQGKGFMKTVKKLSDSRRRKDPDRVVREVAELRALQLSDDRIVDYLNISTDYLQKIQRASA